MVRSR